MEAVITVEWTKWNNKLLLWNRPNIVGMETGSRLHHPFLFPHKEVGGVKKFDLVSTYTP